jgi:hypothetical protein
MNQTIFQTPQSIIFTETEMNNMKLMLSKISVNVPGNVFPFELSSSVKMVVTTSGQHLMSSVNLTCFFNKIVSLGCIGVLGKTSKHHIFIKDIHLSIKLHNIKL